MKVSAVTLSSLAMLFVAGCSFTPGEQATGSFDYVDTQVQPPLQPAPGLGLPLARDQYNVPSVDGRKDIGKNVNIQAPTLVWPTAAGSRVEEADGKIRVHFDELEGMTALPDFIWNTMNSRLQADGVSVQAQQPPQRLETGWIRQVSTIGEDDLELITERRFAIDFESPSHARTVAVEIQVIDRKESGAGAGIRTGVVDDRNQATLLLNNLINEVAIQLVSDKQQQNTADAYTVSAGFDANGYAALLVDTSFINTWTMVGIVLPELGFKIDDLNQSTGRYYTSYSSETSALSKLAFWRSNPSLALASGAYEVQITGDQSNTTITFYRNDMPLSAAEVNALYAPIAAEFRRQLEL